MYNLFVKKKLFFVFLFFLVIDISVFAQLDGIWENGGRFIEFMRDSKQDKLDMRIVLKPYFRYVYEEMGTFRTDIQDVQNFAGLYLLRISYPRIKKAVWLPICIQNDFLFTSFYQRADYTSSEGNETIAHSSPLYGFWLEQGSRDGILLYPNDPPEWIDAYFFTDTEYFKFRYWLEDFERNEKQAKFKDSSGLEFTVPRVLKRGDLAYSCVTANSSVLRNFEKGFYNVKPQVEGYSITITPKTAGPGSHAAADTYPNAKYPEVINLPLYLTADGKIFSYGEPFLFKSEVSDLSAEIAKHNSLRKEPPELQLVPDELDFHWEELKRLQELAPATAGEGKNETDAP